MTDESEDSSSAEPSTENLGRTYADMLDQSVWEADPVVEPLPEATSEPVATTPPSPDRIVEAMLFIGGPPLSARRACDAVRGLTEEQFLQAIDTLNQSYREQGRPYTIQAHGQGYALELRPRYKQIPERLFGAAKEARLSPTALDVLALVAYRQPATKQDIDTVRGAESGNLLRQLVRLGLVAVTQRGESGQREVSYGTTARFLEMFGLSSLDDLPQTQDLQRL